MNEWEDKANNAIEEYEKGNKEVAKSLFLDCFQKATEIWPYLKFFEFFSYDLDVEIKEIILKKAVEISDQNSELNFLFNSLWSDYGNAGVSVAEFGDKTKAKFYFEKCLNHNPRNAWPYVRYISLLGDFLSTDEKEAFSKRALELEPDDFWANLVFIEALGEKYNIQKRIYDFQRKFSENPVTKRDWFKKRCDALFPSNPCVKSIDDFCSKMKSSLVFVNHDSNPYGATHYLFSLFNILKSKGVKCCILDEKINYELYKKYNVSKDDVISYDQNIFLLEEIISLVEPRLIYLNSINDSIVEFYNSNKEKYNIIAHSHEVYENYYPIRFPTHVVSSRIQKQHIDKDNCLPKVQPPIITKDTIEKIEEEIRKEVLVVNNYGIINLNKISIGMCGQTEDRKNPELFLEVARKYRDYNFIWIGGQSDMFKTEPNIYHIKTVLLPYKYFTLFDYFMLFSKQDPCPYVVLENLYINNKIITFKENIYTSHNSDLLQGLYFEYDGEISIDSASFMIENHAKEKANRNNDNGKKYVLENFSEIKKEFLEDLI